MLSVRVRTGGFGLPLMDYGALGQTLNFLCLFFHPQNEYNNTYLTGLLGG